MSRAQGALAGIRVVDLTRILAGPFCAQHLGDHGADVVKVEPPGGDETRTWGPPFKNGQSAYFSGVNRNKRSIALDLASERGREVLCRLLAGADVLIENYKAGTLEKWGLGYDEILAPRFPRLVHCRISGYGSTGPYGGLPGYDAIAQAMSGLMSINGEADGEPVRVGTPMADLAAGMHALSAILMALLERERSGEGQSIEVCLLDAAITLLHPHAANYLMSGDRPRRTGNAHPNIAPYELFPTANGLIFLAVGNDRQFARLLAELGSPETASDPRFRTNADRLANRPALAERLRALLAPHDGMTLARTLLGKGVPAGVVLEIPEVLEHPQVVHNGMKVELDGYRGLGVAAKMSRTPGAPRLRPPHLGEHTRTVLGEAGLSTSEIDDLVASEVVVASGPPGCIVPDG